MEIYFSLHDHELAGAFVDAAVEDLDAFFLPLQDLEHIAQIFVRNLIISYRVLVQGRAILSFILVVWRVILKALGVF